MANWITINGDALNTDNIAAIVVEEYMPMGGSSVYGLYAYLHSTGEGKNFITLANGTSEEMYKLHRKIMEQIPHKTIERYKEVTNHD